MLELFVTFFKLGLFTIGGGVAMIPILSNIMVKDKKWFTEDEMIEVAIESVSVVAESKEEVKEEAEALYPDLTIYYGGELYYTSDIVEKLEKNLIPRMHNTQFALIEFSARTSWKEIHSGLSNVLRAGVTPIVAHIERYDALEENADRVREIINMGCYTQVNSSHVLKPKLFGDKDKVRKKRVRYFLEKNLVHMVASDMHNLGPRPPFMKDAYAIIEKTYGTRRARNLFIENPQTLLENQYI